MLFHNIAIIDAEGETRENMNIRTGRSVHRLRRTMRE